MKNEQPTASFVPSLAIPHATMDISFYKNAFGAIELRRWSNDDGSIHVAEMEIAGAMFHLHEENPDKGLFNPATCNGVSAVIGLMVDNVDKYMDRARAAGGVETSPAQTYEYGYRQGQIRDPFGHIWMIEMII